MVTLKGLTRTLKITRNLYTVLSLKFSKERRPITFTNGFTFMLTWPQFRTLRDHYQLIQKYNISQLEDNLFKIKNDKSEVICSSRLIPLICDLMQKYTIEQIEDNLFKIKGDKFELVGSSAMLGCIQEQGTGEYDYDFRDKVVLDVGGYQGESAVLFSKLGAKKVIIYEPVLAHHRFIRKNVSLNHVNAEIHEEGIGDRDGILTVNFADTDTGFCLAREGQHIMEIKVRNVANVIEENCADVAKFDCEGSEKNLVSVPAETLKRIESYIIEVHTPEIRDAILEKFTASGFLLLKETKKTPQISVLVLRQDHDAQQRGRSYL